MFQSELLFTHQVRVINFPSVVRDGGDARDQPLKMRRRQFSFFPNKISFKCIKYKKGKKMLFLYVYPLQLKWI